jgi:hypothetical protein
MGSGFIHTLNDARGSGIMGSTRDAVLGICGVLAAAERACGIAVAAAVYFQSLDGSSLPELWDDAGGMGVS